MSAPRVPAAGPVPLLAVTCAGRVLLRRPGPGTDRHGVLAAPAAPGALVAHVRAHLGGELTGAHLHRSVADADAPVWVARLIGHAPGRWVWRGPALPAPAGAGPAEGELAGLELTELELTAAALAAAGLAPGPARALLAVACAQPNPVAVLLGARAGTVA